MPSESVRALEAILLVTEEPVTTVTLSQILEIPKERVEELCKELAASYEVDSRGFIVARVAGGWRLQTHPDLAPYVERFVVEGQSSRLSAAALETLAIVAYKQPISRAQVAAIRGVNVEGVMRTLEMRGYIVDIGRDPGAGQAVLFGTSQQFLERLGLDSIDELPSLSEFVPGPEVVEALEAGLSPSSSDDLRADGLDDFGSGASVEPGQAEYGAPDAPAEVDAEVDAGDPDPTARLDEATDRLDALVDEVKSRLEATERALDESDAEHDDENDVVDDADDQEGAGTDAGERA